MESRNDLMLNENQHRLLMCCRMARALGKGEIHLDATGAKMFWRMEKDGRTLNIFHSINEMESSLEHMLENRFKHENVGNKGLDPRLRRRLEIIHTRHKSRTNDRPMVFSSRTNRYKNEEKTKVL